jgi:hypothetical protein
MGFKDALAKQRPSGTAKFRFDGLYLFGRDCPILEVRHAGSSNPAYTSNEIKMAGEKPVPRKDSERARIERAQYYARLIAYGDVVVGWEHVHYDPPTRDPQTGELVYAPLSPCMPERVEEALYAFIDNFLEDFFFFNGYVHNSRNFTDGDAASGVALGKR